MGGLAGHSDLPPPPPGMTTHERLTQLLETEIQHGHLLQARPPAAPPARRVRAARLLSHRLPPPHPHTHTACTRAHARTHTDARAHPRTRAPPSRLLAGGRRTPRAAAQAGRDAVCVMPLSTPREVAAPCWRLIGPSGDLARRSRMSACPLNSQRPPRCAHAPWWVGHARRNRIPRGETPLRRMIHVCPVGATSASTTTYLCTVVAPCLHDVACVLYCRMCMCACACAHGCRMPMSE